MTRDRLVRRLRTYLERHHYPRLAMGAVLLLAGLAGFLTSAGLLQAGVRSMAWRYGLAALVGYGVFLLGLRLWLTLHGRERLKLEGALDGLNLPSPGGGFRCRVRGRVRVRRWGQVQRRGSRRNARCRRHRRSGLSRRRRVRRR